MICFIAVVLRYVIYFITVVLTGVMNMVQHNSTHRCDGSGAPVVLTVLIDMVHQSGTHRCDGSGESVGSQVCCIWFSTVVLTDVI